jgi:hypothetical protein
MFIIFLFFFTLEVFANHHLSPPNFNVGSKRAIFVDFINAEHDIIFDFKIKKTLVISKIYFNSNTKGYPIFDLVLKPIGVILNKEIIEQNLYSTPDKVTKLRILNKEVGVGFHELILTHDLSKYTRYSKKGVRLELSIRDLKDRMFLEQYLPTNFEFDQYEIKFNLIFKNKKKINQEIFANGEIIKLNENKFEIKFPKFYTTSCVYFHTLPKKTVYKNYFKYKSINGREIPVTLYTNLPFRLKKFKKRTIEVFEELEKDYGPWPHKSFIAYRKGFGGMEHSGATVTSLGALGHEMFHSYFAKGIIPANGDSGWIDEGLARWRDKGYPRSSLINFSPSSIGRSSSYARKTKSESYEEGSLFMSYLDYKLSEVGGLKNFLKGYFNTYKYQVVTTEHLKNNLEFFLGEDLTYLFNEFIYAK